MEGAEHQVTEERLVSKEQGKKCSTEGEAGSEDIPADKRPRLDESDVVVPFVAQPKIKDTPISSDASAMKDPAVALSLAALVSLPVDKATFQEELDLVAIAFAAQSTLLTVGRVAKLGPRQRDAIERIGRLKFEAEVGGGRRGNGISYGADGNNGENGKIVVVAMVENKNNNNDEGDGDGWHNGHGGGGGGGGGGGM
ncbi:uncharacterized protein LOC114269083 [Camellia sinensis]|uniref:uncharacterized protein LOC114269083 n=1 Tax=Camellia sinensis TaxID=4442 RepID=UPI001035D25F|nr:uncharacterized protein LOC114269083 [Camellia sinensis]